MSSLDTYSGVVQIKAVYTHAQVLEFSVPNTD
jgi:hypothetical protein